MFGTSFMRNPDTRLITRQVPAVGHSQQLAQSHLRSRQAGCCHYPRNRLKPDVPSGYVKSRSLPTQRSFRLPEPLCLPWYLGQSGRQAKDSRSAIRHRLSRARWAPNDCRRVGRRAPYRLRLIWKPLYEVRRDQHKTDARIRQPSVNGPHHGHTEAEVQLTEPCFDTCSL